MALPLKNNCFVSSITVLALKTFGLESLEWEPRVLRDAMEEKFDLQKLPQRIFDKLNCGYMLVGTNAYTSTIEGFLSANAVMNNQSFDENQIPFNSLKTLAWGVWEYSNLMGDIKDGAPTEEFSSDIIVYIREAAELNGVRKFPDYLKFAENPHIGLPDMGTDPTAMEMYLNRQQSNINDLNAFITGRQTALVQELTELQRQGWIADE
jgi:hypothetical protein